MATTQEHVPIQEINNDLVILKNGSMAIVLQTSAVNFGLLSENEQLAIIGGFAALLNSLSFSIQIVIRSKRLDVSSYLKLLEQAQKAQANSLLAKMMTTYRAFIEKTVRENDVLDKQFYIVIPVSYLELGIFKNKQERLQKGLNLLLPRRDQIIRQMWRTGLRMNQLTSKQLINLFYDFYNPPTQLPLANVVSAVNLNQPALPVETVKPQPTIPQPPVPQQPVQTQALNYPPPTTTNLTTPFIVEELTDDYGTI